MSDVGIAVVDFSKPPAAGRGAPALGDDGLSEADELPRLIHKAILARRFVEVHKHAARQCLRAARVAGRDGDADVAAGLLSDARDENMQARICRRIARDCESRAEALGVAAGAYAATGRSVGPRR